MQPETKVFFQETGAERRRCPRFPLRFWLRYRFLGYQLHSAEYPSMSLDLGAKGLGLRCDRYMRPGQKLLLVLYFPTKIKRNQFSKTIIFPEKDCDRVSMLSEVAWCGPWKNGEYKAGVFFKDCPLVDLEKFQTLLEDLHINHPLFGSQR
jgi:hypothetical protein